MPLPFLTPTYTSVTRKWVYTALTRSTDLSKVFFYTGPSLVTKEINEDDVLERYLELKVHNYKSQDLKAGREIPPSGYVTKQWLFDQLLYFSRSVDVTSLPFSAILRNLEDCCNKAAAAGASSNVRNQTVQAQPQTSIRTLGC